MKRTDYRDYLKPHERKQLESFDIRLEALRAEITKLSRLAMPLRHRGHARRYLEDKQNG